MSKSYFSTLIEFSLTPCGKQMVNDVKYNQNGNQQMRKAITKIDICNSTFFSLAKPSSKLREERLKSNTTLCTSIIMSSPSMSYEVHQSTVLYAFMKWIKNCRTIVVEVLCICTLRWRHPSGGLCKKKQWKM